MNERNRFFIELINANVTPALGCTEPGAVALAAAAAAEALNGDIQRITVRVDKNLYKNGTGVYIPGTPYKGLHYAAALGAISGDSKKGLEALSSLSSDSIKLADRMVMEQRVDVSWDPCRADIFVEAIIETGGSPSRGRAVISHLHDNITYIAAGEKVILNRQADGGVIADADQVELIRKYSLDDYLEFIREDGEALFDLCRRAIEMNTAIADFGMSNEENPACSLFDEGISAGTLSRNTIVDYCPVFTMAGAYERMRGKDMPVMALAGSGNQGLASILPLAAAARQRGLADEDLYRAVILCWLIAICGKSYVGMLGPVCGAGSIVTSAAGGALVYLLGGSSIAVSSAVRNTLAAVSGMLCDGAKESCASRIYAGTTSAMANATLALHGKDIAGTSGIIAGTAGQSFEDMGRVVKESMEKTDASIIGVMEANMFPKK